MKPRIYSPTETDFSTNGLGILTELGRSRPSSIGG